MESGGMGGRIEPLYRHFYDRYDRDMVREREAVYAQVKAQYKEEGAAIQNARAFAAFLEKKRVRVEPWDLLAGHIQHVDFTASIPVIMEHSFNPARRPAIRFDIGKEIEGFFRNFPEEDTAQAREVTDYFYEGTECGLGKRWAGGHVIAGYGRVMKEGLACMARRLEEQKEGQRGAKRAYTEAMLLAVRAAQNYCLRYALAAEEQSGRTENREQQDTLAQIAHMCRNISREPAGSFREALQMLVLLHELLTLETHSGSVSLGRVDQMLYPYYRKDVESGILTKEDAADYIDALWLKIAGLVYGFQNVTVGGCDREGIPGYNDITLFCLQACRKIGKDQPLLSLRCRKEMPDAVWQEALLLVKEGGGFPAFFNDDCVIIAKSGSGVGAEDAENYGLVGCVEPSIGGKEYSGTEGLRVNWAKVLELMLHRGLCSVTEKPFALSAAKGADELDNIRSFEQFYEWYVQELRFATKRCIRAAGLLDKNYAVDYPSPFLSATIEGCIEAGEDAAANGPVYRFSTVNGCGMADTVDSLMVIKKAVFEEGLLRLSELAEMTWVNFRGYELWQKRFETKYPKYGNGLEEPDHCMRRLVEDFTAIVKAYNNPGGFPYQVGLHTAADQGYMGKSTGALPSGRKKGVSLANAVSPCQGMDRKGPRAVIHSVTGFSHTCAANGLVLDLKFTPRFLEQEQHEQMLRELIRDYFDRGGMAVQFNVAGRQALREAQKQPERYRNLVVGVSGFSAYFVMLDPVLQNEIIKRTEYGRL